MVRVRANPECLSVLCGRYKTTITGTEGCDDMLTFILNLKPALPFPPGRQLIRSPEQRPQPFCMRFSKLANLFILTRWSIQYMYFYQKCQATRLASLAIPQKTVELSCSRVWGLSNSFTLPASKTMILQQNNAIQKHKRRTRERVCRTYHVNDSTHLMYTTIYTYLVQSMMVLSLCAMVSTVQSANSVRMVAWIRSSVSRSTAAVASSSTRIFVFRSKARARHTSCL